MSRVAVTRPTFDRIRPLSTLSFPYDGVPHPLEPRSPHQRPSAVLSTAGKYLTLRVHETALPDALFEDTLLSEGVRWVRNIIK